MPATHVTNAVAGTSVPSQMTLIHSAHYATTLVIPVLDHQLTNVPPVRLVSKKKHQEKVMRRRRNVLISTNVLKQPVSVDSELTVLTLKDHTPVKIGYVHHYAQSAMDQLISTVSHAFLERL